MTPYPTAGPPPSNRICSADSPAPRTMARSGGIGPSVQSSGVKNCQKRNTPCAAVRAPEDIGYIARCLLTVILRTLGQRLGPVSLKSAFPAGNSQFGGGLPTKTQWIRGGQRRSAGGDTVHEWLPG